ncbi:MAG: ABC-F family ATP-binding cassette domain-containing protein [Pseudomonadota bacterium]
MLLIDKISKSYGGSTLFEGASMQLQARDRLGLIGRNGSGKTTLFRMILGEVEPDAGKIILPSGYRIGHVAQHLRFTKPTLLEEGCLGLPHDEADDLYKVERILFGLGFTKADLNAKPDSFSGGFQVRLNLAKILVSRPNLLLLDEPTNYLDILSIRWIVKFLKGWKHELIIISHDHEFMDSIITHTALIHRQRIKKLSGNISKIYAQIKQDETVYEKTRLSEEKQRKHMEKFVERFKAKASKASQAQSRIKMLEKLPKSEALSRIADLEFSFRYDRIEAKRLMSVESLNFGYVPEKLLIRDLDMTIHSDDRVAIVGKNGSGKSTLIRLLANELTPLHGAVKAHPKITVGYFGQTNIDRLDPKLTIEEEISSANTALTKTEVLSICGVMMFGGELAQKKIQVLSGGEKSRVMLGKIIATKANILLLDEPSNHLDMQSTEALVDALKDYPGAVVFVTHSEMLLRSIAKRLLVFQGDKVSWFEGEYEDFLNKVGWLDEKEETSVKKSPNSKKIARQQRAAIITERSKTLKPLQVEIKMLESRIVKLEAEEADINERLGRASREQNIEEIASLSKTLKQLTADIEDSFKRLEIADAKHELLSNKFSKQMGEL